MKKLTFSSVPLLAPSPAPLPRRAYYGIDSSRRIQGHLLVGLTGIFVGWLFPEVTYRSTSLPLGGILFSVGFCFALSALLHLHYSLVEKLKMRTSIVDGLGLRGDELVLDVGTGLGLLLTQIARRLSLGKAYGIDLWDNSNLSRSSMLNTLRNIEIEGVENRVEIRKEDARKMSFPDDFFDVVVTHACLHELPHARERERAVREMIRVLKPEGKLVISDSRYIHEYEQVLNAAGFSVTVHHSARLSFFRPFFRVIHASRPDLSALSPSPSHCPAKPSSSAYSPQSSVASASFIH